MCSSIRRQRGRPWGDEVVNQKATKSSIRRQRGRPLEGDELFHQRATRSSIRRQRGRPPEGDEVVHQKATRSSIRGRRGPLQSSKGFGGCICLSAQVADKANPCSEGTLAVRTGMAGTSGRRSLALAFLACHRCSAAAVQLASHIVEPL